MSGSKQPQETLEHIPNPKLLPPQRQAEEVSRPNMGPGKRDRSDIEKQGNVYLCLSCLDRTYPVFPSIAALCAGLPTPHKR